MRGMIKGLLAAAALLGTAVQPAAAAVQYDFTAYSSISGPTGSFSYIAPNFIFADAFVTAAAMSSCAVYGAIVGTTCYGAGFNHGIYAGAPGTLITFGLSYPTRGGSTIYYYFDSLAFRTPGTNTTVAFGNAQYAELVVTDLGGTVPEPATWALMIGGFGLVGGALRQRRAAVAGA